MTRRRKITIGVVSAIAVVGLGAGAAVATGLGDDEEPAITGSSLERATTAALEFTGEGRVTDTEVGDEESLYEVEVTLDDGTEVDVQLDEDFAVVGSDADGDEDGAEDE